MKAAIYLRVSTEEQRERQSIATQRDFAERYCDLYEIAIADFYADDGVSGTVPLDQRPQGARLLEDAKAKAFDTVLIYKLDRLGRDPRLILNAVNELETLGAEVKSMTEPFDTASPSGRFMLTILSGAAGYERDTIIQRSVEGTTRLAHEGVWLGGVVPYGYRVEGNRKEARLVISGKPIPGTRLTEAGTSTGRDRSESGS
jgi:site-specific DNA recombinase